MYKFDSETKLYLVTCFTDFRCGIDALTRKLKLLEVNNVLQNTAYIFMCKTKNKIKILHWGGAGFRLSTYRLEDSKFKWIKEFYINSIGAATETDYRMKRHNALKHYLLG